jgi:hypothetical protein
MAKPDWQSAEDVLFEKSRAIIGQFSHAHPDELFSLFAFTVDSEYEGVALNFDTPENSLKQARRDERYRVAHLKSLFALEHGWKNARYSVAHQTTRMVDWNPRGEWKYDLVAFVELPVWEDYFNSSEETPDLEGRIIVALWRVADRLIEAGAFDGLRQGSPFRIAFSFHDDETIVLRILNWPRVE